MSEDHIGVQINGVLYVKFEDAKKLREGWDKADDEIEKLRAAICEWAASIWGYEGVLFLEGLKHEKFINSILDAERDRVEGEQKE
jgi:hypothetical protein